VLGTPFSVENSFADLLCFPPWAGDPGQRYRSTPFHDKSFNDSSAQGNDLPFRIARRNARGFRGGRHLRRYPLPPATEPRIVLDMTAFAVVLISLLVWLGGKRTYGTCRQHFTRSPWRDLRCGMRLSIYKDGIRIFGHRPVWGWALGTFPVVYPNSGSSTQPFFVNEAHNDYVQLLAEMALLGSTQWCGSRQSCTDTHGVKLQNGRPS
jgi:hypothetical protein